MSEKIYLYLLVLCGIWSHGIIGTLGQDEKIKESSDFLVRQKRVVSRVPGEDRIVTINNTPYIVAVKYGMRIECVGSIISHQVVITAASCVLRNPGHYQITSSTSRTDRGQNYNVTDIKTHLTIGLLTIERPFEFGTNCNKIELHVGPLLPGTLGRVSGWGFNWRNPDRGTNYPRNLRSIEVPILAHRNCVDIYRPLNIVISDKEVCTYHPQCHCGHNDFGAPLVVDGYLAGVHLWSGPNIAQHNPNYPDIFVILQHSAYSQWIRSNI